MENLGFLENLISRYNISMQTSTVTSNPIVKEGGNALKHYRCRLRRPGKEMDAYLTIGSEDDGPTVGDVMFALALDASGCEMLACYHDKQEWLYSILSQSGSGTNEFEEFWEEYESRCEQSKKFRHFLGRGLYQHLIDRLGFKN